MKLRNNRFKYQNQGYLESIGWEQLRNCLFRFLKEFGLFSKYINEIKPYMVKTMFECDDEEFFALDDFYFYEVPISYKDFIRRERYAQSRRLFPPETCWDDIYEFWVEWSFENDKIYSKTTIQ